MLGWIKKVFGRNGNEGGAKWHSGALGTYIEFPRTTVDNKEIDSRRGAEGPALVKAQDSSEVSSTDKITVNGRARIPLRSCPPPLPKKVGEPGFWDEDLDPHYFDDLIEEIKDPGLKLITRTIVFKLPKWFWIEPASMSGRYHPPDSNGRGGTARHSRKVAIIARDLGRTHDLDPDITGIAGMFHDCAKRGLEDKAEPGNNGPSFKDHGRIGTKWLFVQFEVIVETGLNDGTITADESLELRRKWCIICKCVETHMGKWGPERPKTNYQRVVHYADMFASNKHFVSVDSLKRKGVMR